MTLQQLIRELLCKLNTGQLKQSTGRPHSLRSVCGMAQVRRETLYKIRDGKRKPDGELVTLTMEQAKVICDLLGYKIEIIRNFELRIRT